jgi:outer membrane usher protein
MGVLSVQYSKYLPIASPSEKPIFPTESRSFGTDGHVNIDDRLRPSSLPLVEFSRSDNTVEQVVAKTVVVPEMPPEQKIKEPEPVVQEELPAVSSQKTVEGNFPASPSSDTDFDFSFGDTAPSGIPDVPTMLEAGVQSQAEYDRLHPVRNSLFERDASFFDDFYVAGQDTSPLIDDGTYYMALYVNDLNVGDVEVKVADSVASINKKGMLALISGKITDEAAARLSAFDNAYFTVDGLAGLGVKAKIDVIQFTVHLTFDVADMPLQIISLTNRSNMLTRNDSFGIYDAKVLKPEPFSDSMNLYLSTYRDISEDSPLFADSPWDINLNVHHAIGIKGIAFDLSNQFVYTFFSEDSGPFSASVSDWVGYFDIPDKSLRVTFGQTGGYLSTTGTPIGFSVEKSYSYGKERDLGPQFVKDFVLKHDAKVTVTINGKKVYSAVKKKGEYKFIDLPLITGNNYVKFTFEPLDDSFETTYDEYTIPYDTRLLGRGDYLYGFSAAIDKTEVTSSTDSLLKLPYLDGTWYEYHPDDFQARFYLNAGLTHWFTLNTSFAFKSGIMQVNLSELLATYAGSFQGSTIVKILDGYTPTFEQHLNHTFVTPIGNLLASAQVTLPIYDLDTMEVYSPVSYYGSLSYTLDYGNIPPISTSASFTYESDVFSWTGNMNVSYTPQTGLDLVGSMVVSASTPELSSPDISFQVGVSMSYGDKMSSSASYNSSGDAAVSVNWTPRTEDSVQMSLGGLQLLDADSTAPTLSLSWSHISDFYSLALKDSMSDSFGTHATSLSLGTAILVAGPHFAINRTGASNFLLIKPAGKLAGHSVSVGKTNTASPAQLASLLGRSAYTSLTANTANNLIIYANADSLMTGSGTFAYKLEPKLRESYYIELSLPVSFTVSGVLNNSDGTPLKQYSAPVYFAKTGDDGKKTMTKDAKLYLFTDDNGRYMLTDVPVGDYMFDAKGTDGWYAVCFSVREKKPDDNSVIELESFSIPKDTGKDLLALDTMVTTSDLSTQNANLKVFGDIAVSDYKKAFVLKEVKRTTEQAFLDFLYPAGQSGASAASETGTASESDLGPVPEYLDLSKF